MMVRTTQMVSVCDAG